MTIDLQKQIFMKNLLALLEERNLSQAEVAKAIDVSPQTFNTWCRGIALPRMGKIQKLADYFGVDKSFLIDDHTPVYEAAAGEGRITDHYSSDTVAMRLQADEVAVTVKGRSMEPLLCDGDIAIVAATSIVESDSDIMLVKINGDEATLKHVKVESDGIRLIAENAIVYPTRFFTAKEVRELPVTIEGVVVKFIRDIK